MKRLLVLLTLFAPLFLTAGNACCQQTAAGPPEHMFIGRRGCPGAIFGDGQRLYVTAGGKILEYKLDGMTLEHSVDLPSCTPPGAGPGTTARGPFPQMPPPPPPSNGLWAANGKLYVLAGPAVYVYKAPGLTLEKSVMLPGPKPPKTAK